jgi:hypothetical protein
MDIMKYYLSMSDRVYYSIDFISALTQLHKKLEAKVAENDGGESSTTSSGQNSAGESSSLHQPPEEMLKFAFGDEIFFHTELAEELIERISDKFVLDDVVMTLFDAERTRLRRVKLSNASKLTVRGLRVLKGTFKTILNIYFLLYQDWKSRANTFPFWEIHFSLAQTRFSYPSETRV